MRLIDADMLSPDRDYYDNSICSGYDAVSCQQIDSATTVKAIPLDKVKQAREYIENNMDLDDYLEILDEIGCTGEEVRVSRKFAVIVLDKLIAESEG